MWQGLITAGTALALAIPAHLAHHLLSGRVRAIVRDVEWAGNEIMRYLLIEYNESALKPGMTTKPTAAGTGGNGGAAQ
jgi:biopolymer transport protein ExbB